MRYRHRVRTNNIYHIRVKGSLDEKWADWFEGFVMSSNGSGETQLTGPVPDQAALHGVLGKIHGLGLPLLLVAQTGCPCPTKNCSRHGQCQECAAHYAGRRGEPFCFRDATKWAKRRSEFMKAK